MPVYWQDRRCILGVKYALFKTRFLEKSDGRRHPSSVSLLIYMLRPAHSRLGEVWACKSRPWRSRTVYDLKALLPDALWEREVWLGGCRVDS